MYRSVTNSLMGASARGGQGTMFRGDDFYPSATDLLTASSSVNFCAAMGTKDSAS